MLRFFARPSGVLSALPATHYSTIERTAQRYTHDVLRHSVQRLWHPFMTGRHGADLKAYRFSENLGELCTPGITFTCQVNGVPGGKRVLEDFFAILVAGFDIVQVNVENAWDSSISEPRDVRNYRGYYVLEHTRPFLGWAPSPTSLELPAAYARAPALNTGSSNANAAHDGESGEATAHFRLSTHQNEKAAKEFSSSTPLLSKDTQKQQQSTLVVPFSTYVEGMTDSGRLSHLVLRSPAMKLLAGRPSCPEPVRQCLQNKEALKVFATLRRAGVKPDIITAKTLLSVSKQNEAWTAALGIL